MRKRTPFPLTNKELERFWAKVDQSGGPDACWPWTASTQGTSNYGAVMIRREGINPKYFAHRIALSIALGRAIEPEEEACHNCPDGDNVLCCNPAHLWVGTHQENIADRDAKGRHYRGGPYKARSGEEHGRAKLTEEKVRTIRALYQDKSATLRELAREHGVTDMTIHAVVNRRTWKDVA